MCGTARTLSTSGSDAGDRLKHGSIVEYVQLVVEKVVVDTTQQVTLQKSLVQTHRRLPISRIGR